MNENEIKSLLPDCLLHSAIYSLIITDLEGKYIFVNDAFKNRFSFVCENFVGQSSFIAIYPEDHDKCLQAVNQCFEDPNKVVKVRLRKPDTNMSDFYWTEWEFSVFKDSHKNIVGVLCLGNDITESERASRQTREFSQKVDTIIEEITDGFYQLDRDWKFIKVNKVAEQILGINRIYLLGRTIWDIFPGSPDFNYPTAFHKAVKEYITVTFEDYRADLDTWFSTVCYPSPEGLTIFFRDITQEKKNQERLKYSKSKLRAILDSTTDSNILISPDYKILCFNAQANKVSEAMLGKSIKEMADIWEYILPNDKADFYKDTERAFKGEYLRFEREVFFKESSIWFEISYFPVFDSEGKILGITLNTTNIDQNKRKEITLLENKNRLDKIIEAIPHPLMIVTEQMNITYVNDEFEKVFGYTSDDVLHKNISFLIPQRYRNLHIEHEKKYLKTGGKLLRKFSENISAITKNNQEISIDVTLNTFTINGERAILMILQDITEFKKKQNTILKQNETLRQIAWQQSHEVRRPVATIMGLCDLLKNDEKATEEEKQKYFDYLLQSSKELDEIIHKIVAQSNENEYFNE